MTVNGNPVDYHTIHPSLPLENGPAKTDLYTTPQYRWEPSEESSGNASRGVNRLAQGWAPLSIIQKVAVVSWVILFSAFQQPLFLSRDIAIHDLEHQACFL